MASSSQDKTVDMELTERLSALLDEQRDTTPGDNATPSSTLYSLLSLQALTSPKATSPTATSPTATSPTATSPTATSPAATTPPGPNSVRNEAAGFRKIGFGQCGLVFERPTFDYAVKVARPGFADALATDHGAHVRVYAAFNAPPSSPSPQPLECRVPSVVSFLLHDTSNSKTWWTTHAHLFPASTTDDTTFPLPAAALLTQRIPALPKCARDALVTLYCPPAAQAAVRASPTNRDCLARIYLGRRRGSQVPAANFTLRNFNLHLDQMLDLGLPVAQYAAAVGAALAAMHWGANVDGYDVEFVLGGDDQSRTAARIWVLDFNLCTAWDEAVAVAHPDALVAQLVVAFFENDPYFPLPLAEQADDCVLWHVFYAEYRSAAARVLEGKPRELAALPGRFLDACVERERGKLSAGLGHGHRDFKC